MNIPIEQFIPSGSTLLGTIVAMTVAWNKIQNKLERSEEDRVENRRQIDAFWKWKDEHEKSAVEVREKFNREIAELHGSGLVIGEQFKQIMSILSEIKTRLDELEKR